MAIPFGPTGSLTFASRFTEVKVARNHDAANGSHLHFYFSPADGSSSFARRSRRHPPPQSVPARFGRSAGAQSLAASMKKSRLRRICIPTARSKSCMRATHLSRLRRLIASMDRSPYNTERSKEVSCSKQRSPARALTLPAGIRGALGLATGARIIFTPLDDNTVILRAKTRSLRNL